MKTIRKNPNREPVPRDQGVKNNKIKRLKSNVAAVPNLISEFINIKNLRQSTQKKFSRIFFVLGLCISLLIVITAFEWRFYDEGSLISLNKMDTDFEDILEIHITEQPLPPPPILIQPRVIEVPDDKTIIDEIEFDLDIQMDEEMKIDEIIIDLSDEIPVDRVDEIFTIVEQ